MEITKSKSKSVVVAKFNNYNKALIAKSILEMGGVNCQIINYQSVLIIPMSSNDATLKIEVADEDYQKAIELLDSEYSEEEFDKEYFNEIDEHQTLN